MRVLVIDDEEAMREVLSVRLGGWGFEVCLAADAAEAEHQFEKTEFDVVLADVMLPDASGLELLEELRARRPGVPVVMITAHGTVDLAVDAIKEGALDFLSKPLDYDNLRSVLEEAQRVNARTRCARKLASELDGGEARFGELIGASPAMMEVYNLIGEAGPSDAPVLITGESGTGKELTARSLHGCSERKDNEFVPINAAAIPKELMESELFGHEKGAFTGATGVRQGCFEQAHGGTLFLDEIAEMPLALQPKLLRVLEDGRVRRVGGNREHTFDVRLLSATNQIPQEAIEAGSLREDLFYRLNLFQIRLPPLRDRHGDVPLLVRYFLEGFNRKHRTSVEGPDDDCLELLESYPWPGNVRELRNVVERAVVVAKSGWLGPSHLPPYLSQARTGPDSKPRLEPGMSVAEAEKQLILMTLEQTGNNKAEAARQLGLDVKTVRNKLKRYGITVKPS